MSWFAVVSLFQRHPALTKNVTPCRAGAMRVAFLPGAGAAPWFGHRVKTMQIKGIYSARAIFRGGDSSWHIPCSLIVQTRLPVLIAQS
jgi:hypothetical protein